MVNPVNGEKVPVWVATTSLSDYGTGAVSGRTHRAATSATSSSRGQVRPAHHPSSSARRSAVSPAQRRAGARDVIDWEAAAMPRRARAVRQVPAWWASIRPPSMRSSATSRPRAGQEDRAVRLRDWADQPSALLGRPVYNRPCTARNAHPGRALPGMREEEG